jgi:hypothetical protein
MGESWEETFWNDGLTHVERTLFSGGFNSAPACPRPRYGIDFISWKPLGIEVENHLPEPHRLGFQIVCWGCSFHSARMAGLGIHSFKWKTIELNSLASAPSAPSAGLTGGPRGVCAAMASQASGSLGFGPFTCSFFVWWGLGNKPHAVGKSSPRFPRYSMICLNPGIILDLPVPYKIYKSFCCH